jgi:hypothetical protein
MVLGNLRGHVFLTLKKGGDVALKFDEFASDGFGGTRADEAAAQGSREDSGTENGDITKTHGNSS